MTETDEQTRVEPLLPSQVRCTVSTGNQFQLPAAFVEKLGYPSTRSDLAVGALVTWYYHKTDDKAMLVSGIVDHPTLEHIRTGRLSDISNEAVAAGDVTGARVTIPSKLPDALYERLTRGNIVLKPVWTGTDLELDATYVSVYPAQEYDRGLLPNVDREFHEVEDDDGTVGVESVQSHTNSAF